MLREIAAKVKEIENLVKENEKITSVYVPGCFLPGEADIFVREPFFFENFKDKPITEVNRKDEDYSYEYSVMLEGIKVFCIAKERQAINDLSEVDRDTERA